jgi:hypothetical protein
MHPAQNVPQSIWELPLPLPALACAGYLALNSC